MASIEYCLVVSIHVFFLGHPWIRNYNDIKLPLDILIFRLIKAYIRSSSLRKAALRVSTSNFCFHGYNDASSVWQLALILPQVCSTERLLRVVLYTIFCLELVDEFPVKYC